jgi:hypothetical protein
VFSDRLRHLITRLQAAILLLFLGGSDSWMGFIRFRFCRMETAKAASRKKPSAWAMAYDTHPSPKWSRSSLPGRYYDVTVFVLLILTGISYFMG